MEFRTLMPGDAARLLEFELANRAWFEQNVLARDSSVYTPQGIEAHIAVCLADFERGVMHPNILVARDGRIAGRVNLKDIDTIERTAEVGYRIAERDVGQGLATAALQFLQNLAYDQWKLSHLQAFVTTRNSASARVLEKCGFERREFIPKRSMIQGKLLDSFRYLHIP